MKVLLLPRYGRLGASSRLRSFQFVPNLTSAGFDVDVSPLLDDEYVRSFSTGERRARPVIVGGFRRLGALLRARRYDVIYLQKEALPWFPSPLELALLPPRTKLVVDYDDAVFHIYDQSRSPIVRRALAHKIDDVMARADLVTVGNDYLGQRARDAGSSRVEWLPTVVDLTRYPATPQVGVREGPVVIGWIGSPATAQYLAHVSAAIARLASRHAIRCVAVGARPDQVIGTPFEAQPWSEASEYQALRRFDIGIMPLPDAPWERGKCGYKLIQYMACSLPVVASPVGVNRDIVLAGESGFLAESEADWLESLEALVRDVALRRRLGAVGRKRVEEVYSVDVQAPRLVEMLRRVVGE